MPLPLKSVANPEMEPSFANRRDFVRVGVLSALGLGLGDYLHRRTIRAAEIGRPSRANACILIWLDGGPSHIDMFDPKPDAPIEVRGPFSTISTTVPGVQFSELLPSTARILNKVAVIRSVTSPLGEHNFGAHYLLTGFKPTPALEYATYGSVISHLRPSNSALPAHVAVPDFRIGGGKVRAQGFLPESAAPFEVGSDPGKSDFRVRELDFYPGLTINRLAKRKRFLAAFDGWREQVDGTTAANTDPVWEAAYRMLTTSQAREAFNLDEEPASMRDRYGRRTIGQSCLLARRLVERGVSFVTVNNIGWDTHQSQYLRLKEGYTGAQTPVGLVPLFDQAFACLVDDLSNRGLLEETLVIALGEFGRTPKINTDGGRDHWPRVFSMALAGGGIAGGQVVGASDAVGESPSDRPISPADIAATIYAALGIDGGTTLNTIDGRPIRLTADGKIIQELYG